MEKLLEDISFDAGSVTGDYLIDADVVTARLAALAAREDLARYVL
jgi:ATP-dependent HslUV protease ATP-binding subunit HslU